VKLLCINFIRTNKQPASQSNSLSVPVGTIWPYTGDLNEIPDDWHLCDGTNGTPDLRGKFLQSYSDSLLVNNYIEAGLPNITGTWGDAELSNDNDWGFSSGAFRRKWYSFRHDSGNGDGSGCWYIDFDASRCSSIYGNSNTVQPSSYTVYYIMKIK